jgi:hypothetical protein
LDGGEPVTFKLDPLDPASDSTVRDINFIEVGGLSANIHNLTVVFNGPSTPLVLNRLLVQGGNFVIESEGPTPSSFTTSYGSVSIPLPSDTLTSTKGQDLPSGPPSAGTKTGAIAGGVVGGLVFLTLVAIALRACIIARRKTPGAVTLQAHDITTNQGAVAVAGRDVNIVNHYWNAGT